MSTTVIDKNEARVPFFGDKMSFITGLDPLGLQNPSVKAYSYLLPGLNNVTGQIRCYSFYSWLLNEYSKRIKSTDPKEQKKFIRKAEYIIALISQVGEIPGISGRQYASNRVSENPLEFDLNTGTYNSDGSTIKTYWQYGFGVFGQYYVGSMRQIGIIDEPTNERGESLGIYRKSSSRPEINVSGGQLAEAFDENISEATKSLFLKCIDKASINTEEINQLIDEFNLRKIDLNSIEWKLLMNLLLSVDEPVMKHVEPSTMRKETLFHILNFTKEHPTILNDREFTMFAYNAKGRVNDNIDSCLTGWYYYQLNEYWQVACTSIFDGCLRHLEMLKGPGWLPLQELIQSCTDLIVEFVNERGYFEGDSEIKQSEIEINESEHELYDLLIRGNAIEKMSYGFLLILKIFSTNHNNFTVLEEYAHSRGLNSSYDGLKFLTDFEDMKDYTLRSFVRYFINRNIINRHQVVAYRKMGGGSQSTQKFIVEDGLIRQIGNFVPGFTGPRVGNLITFLKDLHLITDTNELTAKGQEILSN